MFLSLVEEFQRANPNITIEAVNIPFGGMEPKILTALATETAPDIGRVDVSFLPKLAIRGALHALDDYGVEDLKGELRPVALSSCIVDGKTYGIPDQVNGLCLFYNKDLFRDAGLDPEVPPETWEFFGRNGVEMMAEPTAKACESYNRLCEKHVVVGAFHLTC